MKRWRFLHAKRFGARLHLILRSDADRELHDHPFDFVSIVLWGGYFEHRADGSCTWYGPGSVLVRQAETLHKLELAHGERPAVTLVLRGRLRRPWGFMTDTGWVHWAKFTKDRLTPGAKAEPYSAHSSL